MPRFQSFCEELNIVPLYLVDWPIAQSDRAKEILADPLAQGKAEIGVQLHPWVSPPHDEEVSRKNSFTGNLPPALEREKFSRLRDAIAENFGTEPQVYRAGRYGLGEHTVDVLKDHGIAIDTSVRSGFDYSAEGGPDYSHHPAAPYWLDRERKLLELPLTTVFWGMLRKQGVWLQPMMERHPNLAAGMVRAGMLEKISLTPEGITQEEALRGIDMALDDGLPLLVLSFHSPSLAPGHTPYVRSDGDVEALYDWFSAVYSYLDARNVRPTSVAEIIAAVER